MTIPKDFPGKLFPNIPPLKWTSAKIRQTGKIALKLFFCTLCTFHIVY